MAAPDIQEPSPHTSDHLANERTFLAWIRTSIAMSGFAFVVAKFSVWLRQFPVAFKESPRPAQSDLSLPLGIAMMAIGGVLAIVAAWRYRSVRKAIDRNKPAAGTHVISVVTLLMLLTTAALIAYMLMTSQ